MIWGTSRCTCGPNQSKNEEVDSVWMRPNKQIDRWQNKQTDKQTDRQTNRQTT